MRTVIRTSLFFLAASFFLSATPALAAAPAPGFTIDSFAEPTNFSPNDNARCVETASNPEPICDAYQVTATNAGSQPTLGGSSITLDDTLPAGLTVQRVSFFWSGLGVDLGEFACETATVNEITSVQCQFPTFFGPLAPDDRLKMVVIVTVNDPNALGPLTNGATVSGGGAPSVRTEVTNHVSSTPPPFGFSSFNFYIDGLDGRPDTQAGDHPYELTTTIGLNNDLRVPPDNVGGVEPTSVHDVKDVVVDLPLGFVGSTLSAPECTLAQLSSAQQCPPDTKVGFIEAEHAHSPIYNLTPERGVPAEFGYVDVLKGSHILGYAGVVPTPAGYVLRFTTPDVPQVRLAHIIVTFYGNPAVRDASGNAPIPFFTNPTICAAGSLTATIHMDSWQSPGRFNADGTPDFTDPNWASATSTSSPPSGCNALQFTPELKAQPTTTVADTPSGLDFELKLPQTENAGTLATPPLKKAVVTLPAGFTIDPSAGDGLAACSLAQIGWIGPSPMNFNPAAPSCPEASKIGSLELTTPLIPGLLTGAMYLANQNENPFHSVLAAYVVVDDPLTGVLIKIAGRFMPDPHTGQITAVFDENPQLPFSDLKLHFFGGPRAELATPESCGTFTTISALTPWSAPDSGPAATPFDNFLISSGCVSSFAPSFTAGVTNLQAGAYSPFVASFSRADTDQELGGLSVSLPPGLLGKLAGVSLCSEADANAGTCPQASLVGTVMAGAGPGPNPLFVSGKAYLTGPYKGAPFGMSVVVPAIAGPFNFGSVVVRQALFIDPKDAHVTDVSDPFPTILDVTGTDGNTVGIPIRLRRVDVRIDRPNFTFNPTNCNKLAIGGSVSSDQGASSTLAVPFQVTNCATLGFKPDFKVSTSGHTSKANGASLSMRLAYPKASWGSQANIAKVKGDLPKLLPSRLTTLQKACTAARFESNPAGCPAASLIGHVKVITPLLPVPLTGPAYFVSHGGEAFPSLIFVLQGYGVTVDLVGTTFISKAGITSTTFKTVPDVPFNAFELTLPQGKFSALAANGNLCKAKLRMPTAFVAQNGAVIHQSTKIAVTGCPKHKAKHTRKASRHTKGKHGKK
jgi:hypothetical protein